MVFYNAKDAEPTNHVLWFLTALLGFVFQRIIKIWGFSEKARKYFLQFQVKGQP